MFSPPNGGLFLAVGIACEDVILNVKTFPKQDSKGRTTSLRRARGGNASTSLIVMAMLGAREHGDLHFMGSLPSRSASNASVIYRELDNWNVISQYSQISPDIAASTSFIISAQDTGSRTIIHNRTVPVLRSEHFIAQKELLDNVSWVHFEARGEVEDMVKHIRRYRGDSVFLSLEMEKPRVDVEGILHLIDLVIVSKAYACSKGFENRPRDYITNFWTKNSHGRPSCVVLPWGSVGAFAQCRGQRVDYSPAFPPEVVTDTTGAGDTFNGALFFALRAGMTLAKSVRFSCQVAGHKVGIQGISGLPEVLGKGGKRTRRSKNDDDVKRELLVKEDGQEYAQVLKMLGNGRLEAFCFDGKQRQCHIRGKMRKKVWVNKGDIVLLGLRDYQDNKADVIAKYKPDEIRELKRLKQLPDKDDYTMDDNEEQNDTKEAAFTFDAI